MGLKHIYIDGEWVEPIHFKQIDVINPLKPFVRFLQVLSTLKSNSREKLPKKSL